MSEQRDSRLEIALVVLRLAIAAFLLVWVGDKFFNPKHTQAVLAGFYAMKDVSSQIVLWLGIAQLVLVLAFAAGWQRLWTYGIVFVMHAATTVVSIHKIIPPFGPSAKILFWAGIPVLAAMFALLLLHDRDRMLALSR